MTATRIAGLVGLALLTALPLWMPGSYYVNIASQILFYAIFALAVNVLLGYGGLVSLGHAGILGVTSYAVAVALGAGYGHVVAILFGIVVTLLVMAVFAAVSLR